MYYHSAMLRRNLARISLLLFTLCTISLTALAKKKPSVAPINLNTATSEELQQVLGIGPVTAEKILPMQKSYGLFNSADDLRAMRGIGPKRLEKMRKYLTVGKSRPPKSAQPQPVAPSKPPSEPSPPQTPHPGGLPQTNPHQPSK
jgi:competence ComEA-like helix-hairpin-helix protein